MQNFYYDVILGLQYTYLGELIIFDIEAIPDDIKYDTEQILKCVRELGVLMYDTTYTPSFETVGQITEYML